MKVPGPKERNFSTYISRVMKQVHPHIGLTQPSMCILNDYVNHVFDAIMEEAKNICELNKKSTLTSREIQSGVRLVVPGELAKHSVSEGTKAVTKFYSAGHGGVSGNRRMTKSAKAGLQFPVGKILTLMKSVHGGRVGQGAPVYLAAVMEYMAAEVLELSGNAAKDWKKLRITPRHIMLAIRGDQELDDFSSDYVISEGGVIPHIHKRLLKK